MYEVWGKIIMTKILIILFPFIFSACLWQTTSVEEFEYIMLKEFVGVYEIHLPGIKNKNGNGEIAGAPMSWVTILKASKMNSSVSAAEYICIGYRVPYVNEQNNQLGILKIHKTSKNKCPEYYSDELSLTGITYLSIKQTPKVLNLKLMLASKNLSKNIEVPLYNLPDHQEKVLTYVTLDSEDNLLSLEKRTKRQGPKSKEKCFDINAKCEVIKPNICDECEFGSLEVAGSSCPEGGIRFCHPVSCGGKNMPACLRFKKIKNEDLCYQDSPAGFCEAGLNTYCGNDGYLVCL